jgi:hypothetical protein
MSAFPKWRSEQTLHRPSRAESCVDRVSGETLAVGPCLKTHRDAVPCKESVIRPIALLLIISGPSAIIGSITAVIVDAFNGVLAGARAHVSYKVGEVAPTITNGDPTTAIVLISRIFQIVATALHSIPNLILPRSRRVSGRAVFETLLSSQASAAFRSATSEVQITRADVRFSPAVTYAQPNDAIPGASVGGFDGGQAPDPNASEISRRSTVSPSHAVSSSVGAVAVGGWGSVATILSFASNYPTLEARP